MLTNAAFERARERFLRRQAEASLRFDFARHRRAAVFTRADIFAALMRGCAPADPAVAAGARAAARPGRFALYFPARPWLD